MKIIKRFAAVTIAMVMLLSSAVCVMAATSDQKVQSADPEYVVNKDGNDITDAEYFDELKEEYPEVADMIEKVSTGKMDAAEFADALEAWVDDSDLSDEAKERTKAVIKKIKEEGLEFITEFFDLKPVGDVEKNDNGMYEPTVKASQLTDNLENVKVLHYSLERGGFEIIEPKEVNLKDKTITFEVEDLSPVAFLADKDSIKASESVGKAPQTEGKASTWMMWAGAAVVLMGAGCAVSRRKKNTL